MASKRGPGRPRKQPPEVAQAEELELVEGSTSAAAGGEELEADDVLGELGDDDSRFIVAVWRRVESGTRVGKPEYLYRMSPAEFSLDAVRDRSGGGSYEFRVLRRDDRGRERYFRTTSKLLAGPPKEPGAGASSSNGLPPGGPVAIVPAPAGEELRLIREELERGRRRLARLHRELEEERRKSKTPSLLKELAPILAPIIAPFFKPAKGGTEEFVRALELGVKLGARNGGEDSGLGGFLERVAPSVIQALGNGEQNGAAIASSQNGAGKAIAQPAPHPGNGAAAGSRTGVDQAKLVPLWMQKVPPYLWGVLHSWAAAGMDPAERAHFTVLSLPPDAREELAASCEAQDFPAVTLACLPSAFRAPAVVAWSTRFLEALQDELAPAEGSEEEEEEEEATHGE